MLVGLEHMDCSLAATIYSLCAKDHTNRNTGCLLLRDAGQLGVMIGRENVLDVGTPSAGAKNSASLKLNPFHSLAVQDNRLVLLVVEAFVAIPVAANSRPSVFLLNQAYTACM